LLAAGALCACQPAPDEHLDIVFDACAPLVVVPPDGASPEQLTAIEQAIGMWHAAGIPGPTLAEVADAPRLPVRFERAAPLFLGVYEDEVGLVIINTAISVPHKRAVTLAHE